MVDRPHMNSSSTESLHCSMEKTRDEVQVVPQVQTNVGEHGSDSQPITILWWSVGASLDQSSQDIQIVIDHIV